MSARAAIGHNGGPELGSVGFRRFAWKKARAELLPQMPLEIVRIRVKRAREIGLDYKTYATVRATTGRDIVAFLFSTNALRLLRPSDAVPPDCAAKLATLKACDKLLAAHPPHDPAQLTAALDAGGLSFSAAIRAPGLHQTWPEIQAAMAAVRAPGRWPADGVLLVGATGLEREWVAAGRLAGYLPAERYFVAAAS